MDIKTQYRQHFAKLTYAEEDKEQFFCFFEALALNYLIRQECKVSVCLTDSELTSLNSELEKLANRIYEDVYPYHRDGSYLLKYIEPRIKFLVNDYYDLYY